MEESKRARRMRNGQRVRRKNRKQHKDGQLLGTLRIALVLLCGAIVLFALIFSLRPSVQYLNQPEIQRARRQGVLRVGVLQNAPGFSENEQGFEIELARILCRRIFPELDPDITLELIPVNEDTALPKIANDTIDIAIAKQWAKAPEDYTYSTAYFEDAVVLLCLEGDEAAPLAGQKVGVIDNSAAKEAWRVFSQESGAELEAVNFASYQDMRTALYNGNVRFLAVPSSHVELVLGSNMAVHQTQLGAIRYVAVSALEKPGFAMLIDLIVQEMRSDGTLERWLQFYGISQYQPRPVE